jgi:transcriptional regulator with XRE-family HTH domain
MADKDKKFSSRFRLLLKSTGKSGKKLAKEISVAQSAVWGYLNEGRIPEAPILHRLSVALGVTMEYLLTGEGPQPNIPVLLSKDHQEAIDLLNKIFSKGKRETIRVILSNLRGFSRLVELESAAMEEKNEELAG